MELSGKEISEEITLKITQYLVKMNKFVLL
jgi:hypothetical protein